MLRSSPRIITLLKYFKCIEPSKEDRIQGILPKQDGSLAHLMPSLVIDTANLLGPYSYEIKRRSVGR